MLAILLPLEMCTDHGYSTHRSRSQRTFAESIELKRNGGRPPAKPAAAPHVSGAFYPDEHPEVFAEHHATQSASIGPYVSAGLGGLAVFFFVGAGAFMVLGMLDKEPEHIDLDAA